VLPSRLLGARAPSGRITVASIGVGAMGQYHLNAMQAMDECEVVAVCDVDARKVTQALAIIGLPASARYRDFHEVLEREDVDAVNIATPDHWHTPLALEAIRAGKAVYVQKPISLTIAEGRSLADAARRWGAIVQTGSQQRSSRNFRFACELVRNGILGSLRQVLVGLENPYNPNPGVEQPSPPPPELDYGLWLGPAPFQPYSWERVTHFRGCFDYSGGYYSDWGAHHLDIVQWALDMDDSGPRLVEGTGTFHARGIFDVPMDFRVRYEYSGGISVVASLESEQGILFEGTEGSVFVSRTRMDAQPRSLLSARIPPTGVRLRASDNHLGDFFDCIRRGRGPIAHAEVGHRSATVCHLGNIAMRLGRALEWDPGSERFVDDSDANRMLSVPARPDWRLA